MPVRPIIQPEPPPGVGLLVACDGVAAPRRPSHRDGRPRAEQRQPGGGGADDAASRTARDRRARCPGGARAGGAPHPIAVTLTTTGPGERGQVAANERGARRRRQRRRSRRRARRSRRAANASGSARLSSDARGAAPIAARSLRFTASALWPMARAARSSRAGSARPRRARRSSRPNRARARGAITAASSPIPISTCGGGGADALAQPIDQSQLAEISDGRGHGTWDGALRPRCVREGRKKPRFAVWGGCMNLRSRWSRSKSRASGFLTTEACTPRGIATHFVMKHRLKQRSEPSRTKQGAHRSTRSSARLG